MQDAFAQSRPNAANFYYQAGDDENYDKDDDDGDSIDDDDEEYDEEGMKSYEEQKLEENLKRLQQTSSPFHDPVSNSPVQNIKRALPFWAYGSLIIIFVFSALVFVIHEFFPSIDRHSALHPILVPANKFQCKDCDFNQCERALCGLSDNLLCTAGEALNGCFPDDWVMNDDSSCSHCCDTSNCINAPWLDDVIVTLCSKPCIDQECSEKPCSTFSPYKCLAGAAKGGCTTDPYHWLNSINNICTACCDTTKCPRQASF